MKKIVKFFALILLIFGLSGCNAIFLRPPNQGYQGYNNQYSNHQRYHGRSGYGQDQGGWSGNQDYGQQYQQPYQQQYQQPQPQRRCWDQDVSGYNEYGQYVRRTAHVCER